MSTTDVSILVAHASRLISPRLVVLGLVFTMACGIAGRLGPEAKFLGEWQDVKSGHRWAKIYRASGSFIWEDSDGKYAATYRDGQLKVSGPFGEISVVHVPETDRLIAAGHEFERKIEMPAYDEWAYDKAASNDEKAASDIRTMVSAQATYAASNNGRYAIAVECLASPWRAGCIRGYPPNAPLFAHEDLSMEVSSAHGYNRRFRGDSRTNTWVYVVYPETPRQTGTRGYCTGPSGTIWVTPDGSLPLTLEEGGSLRCDPSMPLLK